MQGCIQSRLTTGLNPLMAKAHEDLVNELGREYAKARTTGSGGNEPSSETLAAWLASRVVDALDAYRTLRTNEAGDNPYAREARIGETEHRAGFCIERMAHFHTEATSHSSAAAAPHHSLAAALERALAHDGDPRVARHAAQALQRIARVAPAPRGEAWIDTVLTQALTVDAYRQPDIWTKAALTTTGLTRGGERGGAFFSNTWADSFKTTDGLFYRAAILESAKSEAAVREALEPVWKALPNDPSPHVRRRWAELLGSWPTNEAARALAELARHDETPQVRAAAIIELATSPLALAFPEETLTVLIEQLTLDADEICLRAAFHALTARILHQSYASSAAATAARHAAPAQWRTAMDALGRLHAEHSLAFVSRLAKQCQEMIAIHGEPSWAALYWQLEPKLTALETGRSLALKSETTGSLSEAIVMRILSVLCQASHGLDVKRMPDGWRLTKGHRFKFRAWRCLHELRTPRSAKRQGHRHVIGRVFHGEIRVPSGILCELAETGVPGEPLYIKEEGGWRPWLPLPDDIISALHPFKPRRTVTIVTAEGETLIEPPRHWLGRLKAWLYFTNHFPRLSALRNWRESMSTPPDRMVALLAAQGVDVRFRAHDSTAKIAHAAQAPHIDPKVQRFFVTSCVLALAVISDAARGFGLSTLTDFHSNDLEDLALFTLLCFASFIGLHFYRNWRFRLSRRRIRCVIGGWGSRGKSGTERLKAALINAIGTSVVSKTTGCEALFLYGNRYGKLYELPLFRPFGKATIWEQVDVVKTAAGLKADVFLWECMGLNPEYVDILQKSWMQDDIATITNTYPDHEDIQGPAGIDIPEAMSHFIPAGRQLLTTEDLMFPILSDGARRVATSIEQIAPLEADLLTDDVLGRFPYQEHPRNIALVTALAKAMGLSADFALMEMADRVVPDIGVLKTYPAWSAGSKCLSFTNGFSANEKHGCMSNWFRLGFDQESLATNPKNWVTVLVNNRADRLARSQVFAEVIVQDLVADRFFLVGTNIEGLLNYINESWARFAASLELFPSYDADQNADPAARSRKALRAGLAKLRLAPDQETLVARLKIMVQAALPGATSEADIMALLECWRKPDELTRELTRQGAPESVARELALYHRELLGALQAAERIEQRLGQAQADAGLRATLNEEFRELMTRVFKGKMIAVPDTDQRTADAMGRCFMNATPPGHHNRMMGVQNIKGPGLLWLAGLEPLWQCHKALMGASALPPSQLRRVLTDIMALQVTDSFICGEYLRRKLTDLGRELGEVTPQEEDHGAVLAMIDGLLAQVTESLKKSAHEPTAQNNEIKAAASRNSFASLAKAARELYGEFHAPAREANRRRRANAIYRSLIKGALSPQQAIKALRESLG